MVRTTKSTAKAPCVNLLEPLEDRLSFSASSLNAGVTLSAHQLHLRHAQHANVRHHHRQGIGFQPIGGNLNLPMPTSSALASFGNMALIPGAFGTTANGTFGI